MLPKRFDSIRYSPQCHCHGKSNLDRRFSSLTTWKRTWQLDAFHDTILNMKDLKDCYIDGRNTSNEARITVDHKEPILTEISCIELQRDPNERRPLVKLTGMKSTNSITLICEKASSSEWELFNNVLPHVPEKMGKNITSSIRDGVNGIPVTEKMAEPGSKRKKINLDELEGDPKVVHNQFLMRTKFIKRGKLKEYIKTTL